jgi:putative oxidoreductase
MDRRAADITWAILRFCAGFLLAYLHGRGKVLGGKVDVLAGSVAAMGFPFPLFFAWCAALSEFVGGMLVAVGLATRPAAVFAGFTMLVAVMRHRNQGLDDMELALLYGAVFALAAVIGGGRYSLDSFLRLKFPLGFRRSL